MPSSVIFAGLVVLWLLILVPTVARRQQEVARLSPALLGGRVLERPWRHRIPEVGVMERSGPTTVGEYVERRERDVEAVDDVDAYDTEIDDDGRLYRPGDPDGDRYEYGELADDLDTDDLDTEDLDTDDRERDPRSDGSEASYSEPSEDEEYDAGYFGRYSGADPDDRYEDDEYPVQSAPRYRPGRGGFDPEAAAAAAHAKYTFRQRVVLALLVLLLVAVGTALLVSTVFWWVAGIVGVALAGYLTYLRRQVRIEEAIRARRAARFTRERRLPPEPDEREAPAGAVALDAVGTDDASGEDGDADGTVDGTADDTADGTAPADPDWTADDGEPTRVRGTGEPLGVLPARRRTVDGPACTEHESSLPKLAATPPPPVPGGTSLVDVDADDRDLPFDLPGPHRRAAGE